nr:gliding motility-associated peptidyl-prolyl isomerase GldI [uncultured Flavobacterium sp.]
MKKAFGIIALVMAVSLTACSQQQARRPVSHSEGTFMKESIERNKKLIANEEQQLDSIMKSTPKVKYIASSKGYWYFYDKEVTTDSITPKLGDIAYFDYEIKDIKGNVIYSQAELRPQVYRVDKQNIMMGLRDGIKLMNEGETVTFLFPSHMGFGYHGDNDRIGTNEPLICTVTLNDIKPDTTKQN